MFPAPMSATLVAITPVPLSGDNARVRIRYHVERKTQSAKRKLGRRGFPPPVAGH
jgi:hypothetical protein